MLSMVGFTPCEEIQVRHIIARFQADDYRLDDLALVEKADLPGYAGKVEPSFKGESLRSIMYLASLSPFTVAHELAHVSDISVRRQETRDNLSLGMPTHWHLAHRMSCEYYANRVACDYATEGDIFAAFQSDSIGLKVAARQGDWANALIHHALLLGIFHGMGRTDCDPIKLLPADTVLPEIVRHGMDGFKSRGEEFFDGYALPLAA